MRDPVIRGKLIGSKEAAERLCITRGTLTRWCLSPCPPIAFRLINGRYFFDTADIDQYLTSSYVPAGEPA
jgi:hypothetical protein